MGKQGLDPGPGPNPARRVAAGSDGLPEAVERRLRAYPDFPRPGILFRDIAPVLADPGLLERIIEWICHVGREQETAKVAGIESRGFLLGAPVALRLGVPFVPVRKQGKLPGETVFASYELEYGTARLEMQVEAVHPGERVLVVDDLLATGGTASAAAGLIRRLGGEVPAAAFLVELEGLDGRHRIDDVSVFSIVRL